MSAKSPFEYASRCYSCARWPVCHRIYTPGKIDSVKDTVRLCDEVVGEHGGRWTQKARLGDVGARKARKRAQSSPFSSSDPGNLELTATLRSCRRRWSSKIPVERTRSHIVCSRIAYTNGRARSGIYHDAEVAAWRRYPLLGTPTPLGPPGLLKCQASPDMKSVSSLICPPLAYELPAAHASGHPRV
jgi:hypothetical protein